MFGYSIRQSEKNRELQEEVKNMKWKMYRFGCDKKATNTYLKDFEDAIDLGQKFLNQYVQAKIHVKASLREIDNALEQMSEGNPEKERESFVGIVKELEQVYHFFLINKNDQEYTNTIVCLKQLIANCNGRERVLLKSELENVQAILEDVLEYKEPDFFAMGYYFLYKDGEELQDITCEEKNRRMNTYMDTYFLRAFLQLVSYAGLRKYSEDVVQRYLNDRMIHEKKIWNI